MSPEPAFYVITEDGAACFNPTNGQPFFGSIREAYAFESYHSADVIFCLYFLPGYGKGWVIVQLAYPLGTIQLMDNGQPRIPSAYAVGGISGAVGMRRRPVPWKRLVIRSLLILWAVWLTIRFFTHF